MRRAPRALALLATLAVAPAFAGCLDPADNGWAVQMTQLDALRRLGLDGRGVKVALLDSGIDLGHPSLRHLADGRLGNGEVEAYADFVAGRQRARDAGGHGTFVAGVLVGRPPSGLATVTGAAGGIEGLAPGVRLIVGRVCHVDDCSLMAVWRGLEWAVAQDADVISLSLGFTAAQLEQRTAIVDGIRRALADAESRGILVVAAAGNKGRSEPVLCPASEPTVLAVGAVDRDGSLRATSCRGEGTKPDLVAPGEGIVGPDRDRGRLRMDGTSAAVPFATAAAVLLMGAAGDPFDAQRLADLRDALRDGAAPVPGQRLPHDPQAGHGMLQAEAALVIYRGDPPLPPWLRGSRA